jgi:hypothetical protein
MDTTIKGIKTKEVTTFLDYLAAIKEMEAYLLKKNDDDYVIYRGQSVDKHLFPKLGRDEYNLPDRINYEKKIIAEFIRLSHPHLANKTYTDWDILAIAQHHFLPTRLLDWTGNPLIALWFALFNQPSDTPERVVWCYSFKQTEIVNPKSGSPFNQLKTLVYQPKHIATRIVSQNGWFTSHYYRKENNKYTALNLKKGSEGKLIKIRLIISEDEDRKSFLLELDTYGINSYSVFTDLEGLCQYLDWKTYKK